MITFSLAVQMIITMALGIIAKKTKLVDDGTATKMGALLVNVGIPCLIISSLNVAFDAEEFRSAIIMIPVALLTLAVLFLIGLVYRLFRRNKYYGAAGNFAVMFPNYTYIGLPVMESLYGALGVFQYTIFTMPVRIFFYSTPAFMLDIQGERPKRSLKWFLKVFTSPPLVGLYVGMIIYLCRIDLPAPIDKLLSNMTTFTSVCGMLVCGMLLSEVKIKQLLKRPSVVIVPILSNVVAPLAVMAALMYLPFLTHLQVKIAVMYAALPLAAMLPIWVMKFIDDPILLEDCSLYVLLSTVLSVGTMPLIAWVAERLLP